MDEIIPDIYDVTAGVVLIIAGISLWYGGRIAGVSVWYGGRSSRIWGALMILLGVVVLILNMLGAI